MTSWKLRTQVRSSSTVCWRHGNHGYTHWRLFRGSLRSGVNLWACVRDFWASTPACSTWSRSSSHKNRVRPYSPRSYQYNDVQSRNLGAVTHPERNRTLLQPAAHSSAACWVWPTGTQCSAGLRLNRWAGKYQTSCLSTPSCSPCCYTSSLRQ